MAGASAVAITPGFVAGLVGPSGVHEPASFGLAGWAQQLKPFEASNVGQAVHTSGEPLDDFFTSSLTPPAEELDKVGSLSFSILSLLPYQVADSHRKYHEIST